VEPIDSPELYDFLFGSGVVRDDDGVEVFRGNIDGERDEERTSAAGGGGGGGFMTWEVLCECGIVDIRFILRVSVGLMVLAPSPVA